MKYFTFWSLRLFNSFDLFMTDEFMFTKEMAFHLPIHLIHTQLSNGSQLHIQPTVSMKNEKLTRSFHRRLFFVHPVLTIHSVASHKRCHLGWKFFARGVQIH